MSAVRLLLVVLATGTPLLIVGADHCPPHHWISSVRNKCVPCSSCTDPEQPVVLRTCQLHQDTICGAFHEVDRSAWHHHYNGGHHRAASSADSTHFGADEDAGSGSPAAATEHIWDWQPSSMAFAAVACALFVAALLYILYQHAKQWRHMENMERRFDRDVEQLSAQLMHNIVDLRTIEASAVGAGTPATMTTICAGAKRPTIASVPQELAFHAGKRKADVETDAELLIGANGACSPGDVGGCGAATVGELRRCVYLEQLLVGPSPMRGNVYTEETKPTRPPRPQRPPPPANVQSGISALGLHRMQAAFGKK